jgi:hypothetical protein
MSLQADTPDSEPATSVCMLLLNSVPSEKKHLFYSICLDSTGLTLTNHGAILTVLLSNNTTTHFSSPVVE